MSVFADRILMQLILSNEKGFEEGTIAHGVSTKLHREAFKQYIGRYPGSEDEQD